MMSNCMYLTTMCFLVCRAGLRSEAAAHSRAPRRAGRAARLPGLHLRPGGRAALLHPLVPQHGGVLQIRAQGGAAHQGVPGLGD